MATQYTWFDKVAGHYLGTDPVGGYAGPGSQHPFKGHVKVPGIFDGSMKWNGAKVIKNPSFVTPTEPIQVGELFSILKSKGVVSDDDRGL